MFFLEQKLKTTHSSDKVKFYETKRMNVHKVQIPIWVWTVRTGSEERSKTSLSSIIDEKQISILTSVRQNKYLDGICLLC